MSKHFFGVSAAPALHDRLVRLAKDMGLSVSALAEKIVQEKLEEYEDVGAKIRRLSSDAGTGKQRRD